MSEPRSRSNLSCLVIILSVGCLLVLAGSVAFVSLPVIAERALGPASPDISLFQHIYLSSVLLLQSDDLTRPMNAKGGEQPFEVQLGESPVSIAQQLEVQGLIKNADAFRIYLVYSGLDTSIQAGSYRISPAMTPLQIARLLQDATPSEVVFRILPGWRLEEIAASLTTSGLEISSQAFLAAVSRPPSGYPFLNDLPDLASLEGFLYPDSYQLARSTTVDELVAILLANFDLKVDQELRDDFESQGLNIFEAVILASIVEREAMIDEEMPVIASVFLNRLEAGMRLESDPTVQYALGYNPEQQTWWTNPLSWDNLQVNSPYNTYLYGGFPPGPIANPGMSALKAIANPAQTPYYYFRAACDGSGRHRFAETFDGHTKNACP